MKTVHNIKPIYNEYSQILILGSMPSKVSREKQFFYAHPQNRFWPILESLFNVKLPTPSSKKEFLLKQKIAMWDTIAKCDITSSSDSSIKNVEINDLNIILAKAPIKAIFCTGQTAYKIFTKHFQTNLPLFCLPSPSSANARLSKDDLIKAYKVILSFLDNSSSL